MFAGYNLGQWFWWESLFASAIPEAVQSTDSRPTTLKRVVSCMQRRGTQ